jgi:hypothetical protein
MVELNANRNAVLDEAQHSLTAGGAVPEGYALVPIKPTPKMVDATWNDEPGNESHNARNKRIYAAMLAAAPLPQVQSEALEPVDGDVLPAVGSKVLIHLGRQDAWVEHEVTGYYVWGDLGKNPALHRVFVRVKDAQGYDNARLLMDVRPVDQQPVTPSGTPEDRSHWFKPWDPDSDNGGGVA